MFRMIFVLKFLRLLWYSLLETMASKMVLGYILDCFETIKVDNACSSCYSGINRIESSLLSLSFHSSSVLRTSNSASNYCQCIDDDALVECLTYGSFFELNIDCLGC